MGFFSGQWRVDTGETIYERVTEKLARVELETLAADPLNEPVVLFEIEDEHGRWFDCDLSDLAPEPKVAPERVEAAPAAPKPELAPSWGWAAPDAEGPLLQPTVLFVEEDELTRRVGVRMLAFLGWNVLVAYSGHDALTKYRRNRRAIDCVLLTEELRGMAGHELMRRIRRVDRQARFVLAGDVAEPPDWPRDRGQDWQAYLQRPYVLPELRTALDGALAS